MQQAIQFNAACTECVCGILKIDDFNDTGAAKARFAVWASAWLSVKNFVAQGDELGERLSGISEFFSFVRRRHVSDDVEQLPSDLSGRQFGTDHLV